MKRININLIGLIVSLLIMFLIVVVLANRTQTESTPVPTRLLPQTPPADVTAAIKDSLLGNTSCSLPCWEGITPGITTWNDALIILQSLPFIQQTSLQSRGSYSGVAWWDWKGSIPFYLENQRLRWNAGIVDNITLFPPNVSVEEIINRYGPPEKIRILNIGIPENVEYGISLYYAHRGFEIQVNGIYGYTDAQLKPSDLIAYVSLFEPKTIEEYLLSLGLQDQDVSDLNLLDWRGYGNLYEIYYGTP